MSVIVKGNEITLIGTVGGDPWWEDEVFGHADVIGALAQVGRDTDITVRVNSGGGVASEGAAIHATFAGHKGKVNMVVEGWAASAASLFVMAGTTVTMRPGALLMIHEPGAGAWGSADVHRHVASALDVMGGVYAQVYADRCGKPVDEVRQMMRAETWLGPAEAVAQGFANAAEAANDDAAPSSEPVAFSQIRAYAHAPEPIIALAKSRGWGSRAPAMTASAPTRPTMETSVPTANTPPTTPAPAAPSASGNPPPAGPEATAPADAVAIAEACATAGFPALIPNMLRAKPTMAAVTTMLTDAKAIAEACDSLRVPTMKDSLVMAVASGVSLQVARDMATNAAAARDAAVVTDPTRAPQMAADAGWGAALAKLK